MDMITPAPARRRGRPSLGAARRDRGSVQSISRALSLLDAVAQIGRGAPLSDLAKKAGLPASTAHRLLTSLEVEGFVRQDRERGLWFVGVKAFAIGNAFLQARDFVAISRPVMHGLMEQSGESVNLGVRDQLDMVFLAQVECGSVMRALARPGGRAPMHCSGLGKAMLAALSDDEISQVLEQMPLPRFTDKTLTDRTAVLEDVAVSRSRGFAVDDEEFALGLRCVASILRDELGKPVAAVSLSGPSARVTSQRLSELGHMVSGAAEEITQAIGGRMTNGV